ncbi:MAG: hypothetical protein AB8E15_10900 [Bdellovibrionales bacterium]
MRTILFLLVSINLNADIQTLFGTGFSGVGGATAVRTKAYDLFGAYYNSALFTYYDSIQVSFGYQFGTENFKDINSVVTDSAKYGGDDLTGDIDTDVDEFHNTQLAVVLPFKYGNWGQAQISFITSLPMLKFLNIETQSSFYPEYSLYESDTQRLNLATYLSYKNSKDYRFSVGAHVYFATGSTVNSRLPSSTGDRSSTMDIAIEVKPALSFSFAFLKEFSNGHSIGAQVVDERNAKLAFKADTEVNVLGPGAVPIVIDGSSSLYYDPRQFSASYAIPMDDIDLHFSFEMEQWSLFDSRVVVMEITGSNSFEQLNIETNFQDVYSPKFAIVKNFDSSRWIAGYSYRTSPVTRDVDEANYLDSAKHIIGFGWQRLNPKFLGKEWNGSFSIFSQIHLLENEKVTKLESDSVGYPNYEVGGQAISLGSQIEFKF